MKNKFKKFIKSILLSICSFAIGYIVFNIPVHLLDNNFLLMKVSIALEVILFSSVFVAVIIIKENRQKSKEKEMVRQKRHEERIDMCRNYYSGTGYVILDK